MIEKLIGMKVMHRQANKIGIITNVNDNIMSVSFHGEIKKYSYPAALSTTLELEDEELQEKLEIESSVAKFEQFKKNFSYSINNEIRYLKDTGGKKYRAVDGERIPSKAGEYIYAFDTDTELHFPDGTLIKLWMGNSIVGAYVVACEEFTIMISSKEFLGEFVESIEFTAEQWRLLEALMERLYEMNSDTNSIAYELACKGKTKINERQNIMCGQDYALKKATSDKITLIWGPPGTGKTQTLAKIALEHIERGKRVLMLSYSNVSVDGALLRVSRMADTEPGQVIRYGYPRVRELLESKTLTSYQFVLNHNPELAEEYQELNLEKRKLKRKDSRRIEINKRLNRIREILMSREKELIHSAAFVATTISKAIVNKAIYSQKFDVVIFDEASMAYVPQIIFAGGLARCGFVCLGDFCQLPAIVQNNIDDRLKKDIFDYTGITSAVQNGYGHEWLVMLNIQYRMHPNIADFVGKIMYEDKLKTFEKIYESRQQIAECGPVRKEPMVLIDLSFMYSVCIKTMDNSRINLLSALICARLAEMCVDIYEVGIITPYNAQSRLILSMIRDLKDRDKKFAKITCATVHQFQGSEKPIIIYDAVDCFRMRYPGTLLTSMKNNTADRLFNVALTRAQGKFILVANRDFFVRKNISKNLMFTKVLNKMYSIDSFLDGEDTILECCADKDGIPEILVNDREETWDEYMNDIHKAKKEIHIDIPGLIDENDEAIRELGKTLKEVIEQGVKVIIRTDDNITLPKVFEDYIITYTYVTNPVTIIDRQIIWFGQPLAAADFITEGNTIETEYFPCIRFKGSHTARALQALLEF